MLIGYILRNVNNMCPVVITLTKTFGKDKVKKQQNPEMQERMSRLNVRLPYVPQYSMLPVSACAACRFDQVTSLFGWPKKSGEVNIETNSSQVEKSLKLG